MRYFIKNIHWILGVLIAAGGIKHAYLLHDVFGFSWNIAMYDAACNMVVLALSTWLVLLLIKAYPTKVTLYTYALAMAIGLAAVSCLAEAQLLQLLTRKEEGSAAYLTWLHSTMPFRFMLLWIFYTWIATNMALRKNITALDSRYQQHTDAAELLKEAELFKLRQQLQPHFLYNSLNSINALVMISPDKAQEMIGKLSDFLRGSVRREAEDSIPVNEELVYIESYLAIESVRFGDRLNVEIEKQFSDGCKIPPFLFQPILENAIKFGLYGKTGAVNITISLREAENNLVLTVTNPYDPNLQPPKGTGFGLSGVGRRLYLLYARADLLETTKDEQQFTTILKIPQPHVQSNTN